MRINKKTVRCLVLVLILGLVTLEFVRNSFGTFCVVQGDSMYPTFSPRDVVQAKTTFTESQRGDVVILTDNRGERAIKRVVALPGETVTLYGGFVYINQQRLRELYLAKNTYTYKSDQENERPVSWTLQPDQYFVMGDNRLKSYDSRHYGPVERRQISSVVSLPENNVKPGFCGIIFSETVKATPRKVSVVTPERERFRSVRQNPDAKI